MGDVADSMRARERRTIRPDHLPDCTLAGLCYEELPHSGCSRTGNTYCIHCSTWCICDRLRKAERRARNETARGIYDHLFNKGAAYQWPNVLNTIRDWAENNGLEDPK